jgi:predicted NAD/FAD-binding protein
MKVAIVGGGISGNVAGYYLQKDHDVTLYEANDYIGGHTHTHEIEHGTDRFNIDTGFIVFNYRTYPNFIKLLEELKVDVQASNMGFGVKSEVDGLEYCGTGLNGVFAQRKNLLRPSFHRMLLDILRFNRDAYEQSHALSDDVTLGEFLRAGGYSTQFIDQYIIPMGAAIWSTIPEQMDDFPARFFIRFFHNHGLLTVKDQPTWYVIKNGSREYVRPLTQAFRDRVRLNAPVTKIRRFPGHVEIHADGQAPEQFDAVFIGAHADQALGMLDEPTQLEQEVLSAFPYQLNEAVLHTDTSLLPEHRRAWAAWNYLLPEERNKLVTLTYNMNILQGLDSEEQYLVTLNNRQAIAEEKIIKTIDYTHPVFTPDSVSAQMKHAEVNGTRHTWYCGAYWRNGFHEDGVVSAINAVEHFNEYQHEQLSLRRAG